MVRIHAGQPQFQYMKPLEPPDSLHLRAAQGWLELGNHIEAEAELNQITARLRAHPAVQEVRWQICAAAKNWNAALDLASELIQMLPEHPVGWIRRSVSLYKLGQTAEARDNLLRIVDKFPHDAIMRYDLACYECQLGRLDHAKAWLQKAFKLGDPKQLRLMAMDDPDLEPLRKETGSI